MRSLGKFRVNLYRRTPPPPHHEVTVAATAVLLSSFFPFQVPTVVVNLPYSSFTTLSGNVRTVRISVREG